MVESESSAEIGKAVWAMLEREGILKKLGLNPLQAAAAAYTMQALIRKILNSKEIRQDD
jgi:glycosyltransferase involved in cell wall biosynthesis